MYFFIKDLYYTYEALHLIRFVEKKPRATRDFCGRKGTRTPDLFGVSEAL